MSWHKWWLTGSIPWVILARFLWRSWSSHGPVVGVSAAGGVRTVYRNPKKAKLPYWLGIVGLYYATYAVVSLITENMQVPEVSFQLAVWTIVPPV